MLVALFEQNILQRILPSKYCNFSDIQNESLIYQTAIIQSCKFDIMGKQKNGTDKNDTFNPNGLVSYQEFATVLSRTLYGNAYNLPLTSTIPWYHNHVQKLVSENIIPKRATVITQTYAENIFKLMEQKTVTAETT